MIPDHRPTAGSRSDSVRFWPGQPGPSAGVSAHGVGAYGGTVPPEPQARQCRQPSRTSACVRKRFGVNCRWRRNECQLRQPDLDVIATGQSGVANSHSVEVGTVQRSDVDGVAFVRSGPKLGLSAHHAHFTEEEANCGSRLVLAPSVRCKDDPAPGMQIKTGRARQRRAPAHAAGQQSDESTTTRRRMGHLPLPLRVDPGRHPHRHGHGHPTMPDAAGCRGAWPSMSEAETRPTSKYYAL